MFHFGNIRRSSDRSTNICVCGECHGKPSPSDVEDISLNASPECLIKFCKKVLGNLKCPRNHYLVVFPSKSRCGPWTCDTCHRSGPMNTTPVFYCPICDHDKCLRCTFNAAKKLTLKPRSIDEVISSSFTKNISGTTIHFGSTKMLYCGGHFGRCFCRSCNGFCGPNNGCPCNTCILTAELVMLSKGLKCKNNHLLTCIASKSDLKCQKCGEKVRSQFSLGCELCGYKSSCICCGCALTMDENRDKMENVEKRIHELQDQIQHLKEVKEKFKSEPYYVPQYIPIYQQMQYPQYFAEYQQQMQYPQFCAEYQQQMQYPPFFNYPNSQYYYPFQYANPQMYYYYYNDPFYFQQMQMQMQTQQFKQ